MLGCPLRWMAGRLARALGLVASFELVEDGQHLAQVLRRHGPDSDGLVGEPADLGHAARRVQHETSLTDLPIVRRVNNRF